MNACSWWKKKDKEIHHGQSTISDETLRETQEKFNQYDSNGNGTIDRDELAGLLRALDLVAFIPEIDELVDDDSYKIVIHTAAHKEAGTDSKVSLTLYGENGDSGSRVLTTARNATFERGQISTLRITSADLGALQKVKIGHDNSGTEGGMPGKGWFLDKVVVSKKDMEPVTFTADRWLDKVNAPDKQCEVTLTPGLVAKKKEKKVQKDDKVMYINPVYGPGGEVAAADAAEKLDPLGNPNRRVTIISADDLINADMFDKSDPYCVVFWNGKRVGKTSTIDNTTFPRWDEDFTIQLPESGEGFLRCELYDHDMFGGDDPLGTVEFKLGGPSNPRALLATADYSFPDEKYSGFLTLKVDHAASRFASEGAHEFKDKWMKGMTYREHREKHVFEEWTRYYILAASAMLALFAMVIFFMALGLASCEANNSGYLSTMYIILSPFMFLSGCTGFYGAYRVRKDVEAETLATTGSEVEDPDSGDDDGLQTTGQRILEFYNMCCVLIFVVLTVIIAETSVLESEEAASDTGCDDAMGTLDAMMYGGVLCLILLIVLIYACTLIVSFFEVLQTMAEFLALFLVVVGIFMSVASSFVVKQTICLDVSNTDGWPTEAYIFLMLGIFGMSTVAVSFLGFAAAYQESMKYLLAHAAALAFLAVYGFVAIAYAGSTSATEFITGTNCVPMLTTLSENFLWDTFGAVKYDGRGMSRNQTDPDLSWMAVRGPSEAPSCFPKSLTQFYWEGNNDDETYIDAGSGQVYDASGTKELYGCLNAPRACEHVAVKMSAYDMSIFVATFWLMTIIIGSIASSLWLRKETSMVGHVLIHHHAKLVFWIMKISLLACMIGLPFMFTGGECGTPKPERAPALESTVAVVANVTYAPSSSCFDQLQNGDETDIDCGGSCDATCSRLRGCKVTTDCCPDADNCDVICAPVEPLTVSCYDQRCIDGQTFFLRQNNFTAGTCRDGSFGACRNGLVGTCDIENTCANGVVDADAGETGVDCGGRCADSCPAGSGCLTDDDCLDGLDCGPGTNDLGECFSCSDGSHNGDETDVDCGGSSCNQCEDHKDCATDGDCVSSHCYNGEPILWHVLQCVSYSNGIKDGDETDVDCGGSSNQGCPINGCCDENRGDADCLAGTYCHAPIANTGFGSHCGVGGEAGYACFASVNNPPETCINGALDYQETGTDCGGYQCRNLGYLCPTATCNCVVTATRPCDGAGDVACPDDWATDGVSIIAGYSDGAKCEINEDCQTGLCSATNSTMSQGFCFSCSNGMRDGDEAATDCGGAVCGGCGDGTRCTDDNDCLSSSSCISMELTSGWGYCASRHNHVIDGGETGYDCGGQAVQEGKLCGIGQGCNAATDCLTGVCDLGADPADTSAYTLIAGVLYADMSHWNTPVGGACAVGGDPADACRDGEMNGDETDVDCGGLCASQGRTCDSGLRCTAGEDCTSGSCGPLGTCVSCSNDVTDGDESDVDCGGSCGACADGSDCAVADDCVSGICAGEAGATHCASCSNMLRDGDETGIDCGGSCIAACPNQQCMSDGARCGFTQGAIGSQDAACMRPEQMTRARALGQPIGFSSCIFSTCDVNSDCQTGFCNPETRQCAARTSDQLCQDGEETDTAMHGETDIDCGGTCALTGYLCTGGQRCAYDSDCQSGVCTDQNTCGGRCTDLSMNGGETDVDCGGECGPCDDARACKIHQDCMSGVCYDDDGDGDGICTNCFNGEKDANEVGVDCGPSCERLCPLNSECTEDGHCHSFQCSTDNVCVAEATDPLCTNNIQDPLEPGFNCGGPCLLMDLQCADGQGCFAHDDCLRGNCLWDEVLSSGECISCYDGVLNGLETDIDCGGTDCGPCAAADVTDTSCTGIAECLPLAASPLVANDLVGCVLSNSSDPASGFCVIEGRDCLVGTDCRSGSCTGGICVSCFDGYTNGDESDTDCGGSCAALCGTDAACMYDGDCASGYCRRLERGEEYGMCEPVDAETLDLCSNGSQDPFETDVDCGGDCRNMGLLCATDLRCASGADCQTGTCASDGTCFSCADACGGDYCDPCPDGGTCEEDGDCISGQCTSGTCTSCYNGEQDGEETDLDCGGSTCSQRCAVDLSCSANSDCATGLCSTGTCAVTTPTETCNNGANDGDETGLDCGGAACVALGKQCPSGAGCAQDSDCQSVTCDGDTSVCVSCWDGVRNGQETDIDCGGDVCAPCLPASGSCTDPLDSTTCPQLAQACEEDGDCTAECYGDNDDNDGVVDGVCVSATNGVKDGQEGGIDCGFRAVSLCAFNATCTTDDDCATGSCTDGTCATFTTTDVCDTSTGRPGTDGEVSQTTGLMCRAACENGELDGTETDMDCGGEYCRSAGYTCSAGDATSLPQMCVVPDDCASEACSLQQDGLQCSTTTQCTQNYGMPNTICYIPAPRWGYCDTAAGGGSYAECSDDAPCTTADETCQVYPGECVGTCSSCSDGRMNGAETDIDCGGGPSSCDGCSIGQSCSCGIGASTTGECLIHRDCSGGLQCYAPLPAGGLPASGAARAAALAAAGDAAVCIRPASIALGAVEDPVVSTPGGSLLDKMFVTGSSPSGADSACVVTAAVASTGGVNVALPNYAARLASSPECAATTVGFTASGATHITGPYSCVDKVLSELRLDTTCNSVWVEGATPAQDYVNATVMASMTSADAACDVTVGNAQVAATLVGRPVLVVKGVAINGDCVKSGGCADERALLAMEGTVVAGSLESCDGPVEAGPVEADCSLIPHPLGLPGGCCDAAAPYSIGTQHRNCAQILQMGFPCSFNNPGMFNMAEDCPATCGTCPPAPPPPPALSTTTPSGTTVEEIQASGDTRAIAKGSFMLEIPLGMSGASDGNVLLTLSKDGYLDTKVFVAVTNGNVDVGHVVMVSDTSTDAGEIQGSCLDLYSTDVQRAAFDESGTQITATLYEGQLIFPADEPAYDAVSTPSPGTEVATGIMYRFTDIPAGTYTVVCEAGGIRADRYVYADGSTATFDAVALPTNFDTNTADTTVNNGILADGAIMVSVDWQVMGDRGDPTANGRLRPDLDISGMFQATDDEACHIFTGYPSCGDVELLPDFRGDCDATPDECPLLDGPVAEGDMTAPAEAMIIRQVRGAIYTFYVQYNHESLYPGTDPTELLGDDVLRVVEVNAEVYAGESRIAHAIGEFEVPGTTPYMRLFCVDARSGTPVVESAIMMSQTPPEMCTTCPC